MKPSITMRFALRLLAVALLAGLTTSSVFADTASLVYDPAGNVASRTTAQGTTTYTYDAADRLIAESGPAGNFSYSYDANSVRLSDSGGSYTYSTTSNRLTARHGRAVITDAAGNITSDGLGHTYAYNQAGRMSEARLNGVLLASYDYDYRGLRNRKVTTAAAPQGAQTILYVYDEAGHLLEELSATGAAIRTYVWRDDTPLAQIEHIPSRRVIYFEVDHLNTPRVARDQSGVVVWTWVSDAFGAIQPNQNPSGAGVVTLNLRFPGQYYDQETGLFYNGQRYYDPGMGQYIQSDPIGLYDESFSTYTYVGGNPLNYADPLGLYECTYSITNHTMSCSPNNPNNLPFKSESYVSGNNLPSSCPTKKCQNNAAAQNVSNSGPIPEGTYSIGPQGTALSPNARRLTPIKVPNLGKRGNFDIHGCVNPENCSNGCISATGAPIDTTRDTLNKLLNLEPTNTLRVIP